MAPSHGGGSGRGSDDDGSGENEQEELSRMSSGLSSGIQTVTTPDDTIVASVGASTTSIISAALESLVPMPSAPTGPASATATPAMSVTRDPAIASSNLSSRPSSSSASSSHSGFTHTSTEGIQETDAANTPAPVSTGLSRGAKIGIGVGVAIGALVALVIVVIGMLYRRRRRLRRRALTVKGSQHSVETRSEEETANLPPGDMPIEVRNADNKDPNIYGDEEPFVPELDGRPIYELQSPANTHEAAGNTENKMRDDALEKETNGD
ncbi:hypothetical protein NA57DRAFT_54594 [Rhizodiscina lignyota]|uniref:Mid2 domain-containing protein n=1 Tax=Rhizodiscina lignyota TaxID=1504668 RepID=A0A9P4M7B3_9PEZI|nr:hypothetical protein NA57DRAFT_54594 [Rhizodiscina lignyota]